MKSQNVKLLLQKIDSSEKEQYECVYNSNTVCLIHDRDNILYKEILEKIKSAEYLINIQSNDMRSIDFFIFSPTLEEKDLFSF